MAKPAWKPWPEVVRLRADAVAKIGAASAGHELKYVISIELGGEKTAPDTVVEAVNGILGSVSAKLKLV